MKKLSQIHQDFQCSQDFGVQYGGEYAPVDEGSHVPHRSHKGQKFQGLGCRTFAAWNHMSKICRSHHLFRLGIICRIICIKQHQRYMIFQHCSIISDPKYVTPTLPQHPQPAALLQVDFEVRFMRKEAVRLREAWRRAWHMILQFKIG